MPYVDWSNYMKPEPLPEECEWCGSSEIELDYDTDFDGRTFLLIGCRECEEGTCNT
tara:strand:+ start:8139 stop:8306 length:168 start_codon:yes stop_codon:yes gene_type:complete